MESEFTAAAEKIDGLGPHIIKSRTVFIKSSHNKGSRKSLILEDFSMGESDKIYKAVEREWVKQFNQVLVTVEVKHVTAPKTSGTKRSRDAVIRDNQENPASPPPIPSGQHLSRRTRILVDNAALLEQQREQVGNLVQTLTTLLVPHKCLPGILKLRRREAKVDNPLHDLVLCWANYQGAINSETKFP